MTRHGLLVLLLAAHCTVLALLGVETHYSRGGMVTLAVLYLALAMAVVGLARWGSRWGRPGAWLGAFAIVAVAIGQLREVTREPTLTTALGLAVVAATLLWWGWLNEDPPTDRRLEQAGLLAAIALVVGVTGIFGLADQLRWHLLRHNTLLGTPAYYLLEDPVGIRLGALFRERLATAAPAAQPAVPSHPTGPTPPSHVVFVLLDTLRADALRAWEPSTTAMPKLDARLARAWRFRDVWASATWTRPSVASFFTGLRPEAHGARGPLDALGPEHRTLAEALTERGYATAAFVTNRAALPAEAGFDQGFELYREIAGEPYARAGAVRRQVERWLDGGGVDDRPLFLYLHFLDPHAPYLAGEAPDRPRPEAYRRGLNRELAALDEELAELLDRLEATLGDDTLFVLASDHGEELFEHGQFGHGYSLYQETLWIPVAAWRPQQLGQSVETRLEGHDLFDLVLAAAADRELDLDAWSRDRERGERYASLYYATEGRLWLRPYLRHIGMRAYQLGPEKLVWSAYGDTWELYDLVNDPGETHNLAAERPDRVQALALAMEASVVDWRESTALEPSEETAAQMRALGYLD